LHKLDYSPDQLVQWASKVGEQKWNEAYVYFKHEVLGPAYALHLGAIARGEPTPELPSPPPSPEPKAKATKAAAAKSAKTPATKPTKQRASSQKKRA
jgi:hypothetical protein